MSDTANTDDLPVSLSEDLETGDRFLIYATGDDLKIELRYTGDALWMSQAQIAALLGRDVSVISRHIANILEEGELDEGSSLQKLQTTHGGRPGVVYSLDMVISVGYRVSSTKATLFRRWATAILVRFATRGFVIDAERLKDAGAQDRIGELRDAIRDIRASEANVYAELRQICAMCQDYDPRSDQAREFYRQTQAKLLYAVVNQTPSELLADRANAASPDMGLQAWPKSDIRQKDALVAKNYLAPGELKELNRLTSLLLDIFEDQLAIGRLSTMGEVSKALDVQLGNLGRLVLAHGGRVAHHQAETAARAAYRLFDERRKAQRVADTAQELAELKARAKLLPKERPGKS